MVNAKGDCYEYDKTNAQHDVVVSYFLRCTVVGAAPYLNSFHERLGSVDISTMTAIKRSFSASRCSHTACMLRCNSQKPTLFGSS